MTDIATTALNHATGYTEWSPLWEPVLQTQGIPNFVLLKCSISLICLGIYVLVNGRWERIHPVFYLPGLLFGSFLSAGFVFATVSNSLLYIFHMGLVP